MIKYFSTLVIAILFTINVAFLAINLSHANQESKALQRAQSLQAQGCTIKAITYYSRLTTSYGIQCPDKRITIR